MIFLKGGTTLHTGLGFKFGAKRYLPLKDASLENYRSTFEELELIIMDEASMIPADRLYDVNRRLQEILVSHDPFGGRAVMLVGDLMQLPPVMAQQIFLKPVNKKYHSLWASEDNLWNIFKKVTLLVNFRQGISRLTECFNRVRTGDASKEDKELLESRRLSNFPELKQDKACHVFYRNEDVNSYNCKMLNSIDSELIEMQAECLYPQHYKPEITAHGTVEDTPFMKDLSLKKGARVFLTFNISLTDSLINGMVGTVLDFVFNGSKVKAVIVQFDNEDVGREQRRQHLSDCKNHENGIPIYRTSLEHSLRGKHGARGKVTQFALRLSWASTCHRLQGSTIAKGSDLIVHGFKRIPRNMYYVMLSRSSCLENIFLDDAVDLDKMLCDTTALNEKIRIDEASVANTNLLNEHWDVFYVNIRSFNEEHEDDLLCDVYAKKSKSICLAETWLEASKPRNHNFGDMQMFSASYAKGKGCAALVPPESNLIGAISEEFFQLLSYTYNESIQVVVVYLSSNPGDANLMLLVESLQTLLDPNFNQVIIGDFNFDTKESNIVTRFMEEKKLSQMVECPTHQAGRIIDHIYVSSEFMNYIELNVMFKYYSDHAALQIKFKC